MRSDPPISSVHIERDRLVLRFLERVPEEDIEDLLGPDQLARSLAGEDDLRERGGEVLERGGSREVRRGAEVTLAELELSFGEPLDLLRRIAERGQMVVELSVLPTVDGLLADEPGDLFAEVRIGDLVAIVPDGPDEELLAVGEHAGQRGEHVAHQQITVAGEVARQRRDRIRERHPTSRNRTEDAGGDHDIDDRELDGK